MRLLSRCTEYIVLYGSAESGIDLAQIIALVTRLHQSTITSYYQVTQDERLKSRTFPIELWHHILLHF